MRLLRSWLASISITWSSVIEALAAVMTQPPKVGRIFEKGESCYAEVSFQSEKRYYRCGIHLAKAKDWYGGQTED